MSNAMCLEDLKKELGPKLLRPEQVSAPPGLPTGWSAFDRFLLWHGFPKASVSLMVNEGGGATSLWIRSAAQVTLNGQWVAWINDSEAQLTPWSLRRKNVDLSKVLSVGPMADEKQLLWALQELMSLSLFEMIGCDLGKMCLREHQILKLKRLAQTYKTALVFITRQPVRISSFYSLILHFGRDLVTVNRALQRSTPHILERTELYADTLPQLAAGRRALCG